MTARQGLLDHLAGGQTRVARAFKVTRADGVVMGFTDHDRDLEFDGVIFRAGTGLDAGALSAETGLSVDNGSVLGALRADAIRDADVARGLYDGASLEAWLVQWDAPQNRMRVFAGHLGEITYGQGAFSAELRGLSEALNQPRGRIYARQCGAVLGDRACGVDLSQPPFGIELRPVARDAAGLIFAASDLQDLPPAAFVQGNLRVLAGELIGNVAIVKSDTIIGSSRIITLWQDLPDLGAELPLMRLSVGCDKAWTTCRDRFDNLVNFQGFPDLPADDFIVSYPTRAADRSGGSRR